jgi:peroxiredoxin
MFCRTCRHEVWFKSVPAKPELLHRAVPLNPMNQNSATATQPSNYTRRSWGLAGLGLLASAALPACSAADQMPDVGFLLINGQKMAAAELKGKVTLVNFWATTCVTCVKEMPQLVNTYRQFQGRGFETVAVAMQYDPADWVVNFANSRQLPFKVALDHTGELARKWGDVRLTPTTFLIDKQGRIVKRYVGEPDFQALHQLLDQLLSAA